MTPIIRLNPNELKMHWLRKLLPPPGQDTVDAIADSLRAGAQLPPGYVTGEPGRYFLVAGETRRLAHKQMQRDMDFYVVTEDEAISTALRENTSRKHYKFKYQIAWDYCPLACKVVEISKRKRMGNIHSANPAPHGAAKLDLPETVEEFAESIGVSRPLMFDVLGVYEWAVAWDQTEKPRLFDGEKQPMSAVEWISKKVRDEEAPCTPGQAKAGIAGKRAGEEGKTKPVPKQLDLFIDGLAGVRKWGGKFDDFDGDARKRAVDAIRKTVADWPPSLRAEFAREIKRVERELAEGQ